MYLGTSDNAHVMNNIKSFCRLHENHWFNIRAKTNKKDVALSQFIPYLLEKRIEYPDYKIFGTIDRVNIEENKHLIIDWKTGNVPIGVKRDKDFYSKELTTHYVVEGNFYCLLYLSYLGYKLEPVNGILVFTKDGKEETIDWLDYAIVFTNINPAIVARKRMSMRSIRSIVETMVEIRTHTGPYERDDTIKKCYFCPFFVDDCSKVLDIEIYGNLLRGTNTTPDNVVERN